MAIMTKDEFVQALKTIEARLTLYDNSFPKNCCYFDGTYITSDCWNLGKSILWSQGACAAYSQAGQYAQPNGNCGDYDACGLFDNYATYRSTDWNDLINNGVGGEWVRMNNEHMGFHVGGGVIVECTPIWENGVQYTYLRTDGSRISAPEYGSAYGGNWTEWCRMSQIDYGSQPKPEPVPTGDAVHYAAFGNGAGWYPSVSSETYSGGDSYAGDIGVTLGAFTMKLDNGSVNYQVHVNGAWWPAVSGYSTSDTNAYAGECNGATVVDAVCIHASCNLKYRVYTAESGWLGWVYSDQADINNYDTGYAGIPGQAVQLIEIHKA